MACDAVGDEDDVATLRSLVQLSITEEGRLHLIANGTVQAVLRRLSSSLPIFLLDRLRLVRNLCCTSAGRDVFFDSGGLDRVASVLVRTPPIPAEVLRIILQVIGNAALADGRHRAAVWARFFPNWFLEFACIREPLVVGTLCTVLDACLTSTGGGQRLAELCEPDRGLPILLEIVFAASRYSQDDNKEYWLDRLFCKVCVEELYFLQVFEGLTINNSMDADCKLTCFSREQACLLKILARHLSDQTKEIVVISEDFALGLLKTLNHAAAVIDFTSRSKSFLPTGNHDIDTLGFSLNILKETLCWENKYSQTAITNSLISAGLLTLVLELLQGLEPPEFVRKFVKGATEEAVQASVAGKFCPYIGYQSDVIAVAANCLYRRKEVQDKIREQNGIPLLLQQYVVDDDCTHLKEWVIASIRNLMQGNVENQQVVAELELKEPIITHPMAQTGLRVEIDKDTQRPKLVNI